ncbi:hypothetical protein HHK36_022202 [Tetracentron sinense]|uniref:Bifunctional inhibitor/plant lipid transfer protein/seed storage helical domain-containing protein n=1 Tax=Tetracentron sinense TaxID=13715 RepID=A0A835D9D6_TETSI|nr:hypothetical protein HHK36_022202 [Tetracentron sinense]
MLIHGFQTCGSCMGYISELLHYCESEGNQERKKKMEMLRKLVLLLLFMAAIFAEAKALTLCNMDDDGLTACKPSVSEPNPADPTELCCKALAGADLKCLCSYKNSMLLPAFGIDPDLAMQLPTKDVGADQVLYAALKMLSKMFCIFLLVNVQSQAQALEAQNQMLILLREIREGNPQTDPNEQEIPEQSYVTAADCRDPVTEDTLVQTCIGGLLKEFRVHLENLGISNFSRLQQATGHKSESIKLHDRIWRHEPCPPKVQSMAAETTTDKKWSRSNAGPLKKSKAPPMDVDEPPPFPVDMKFIEDIFYEWLRDGVIRPPILLRCLTPEDKKSPNYYIYHHKTSHSTSNCWTLRQFFHKKVASGEVQLPNSNSSVYNDPLPSHNPKERVAMVLHVEGEDDSIAPSMEATFLQLPVVQSFMDHMAFSEAARHDLAHTFTKIVDRQGEEYFKADSIIRQPPTPKPTLHRAAITFTNADMLAPRSDHNRPLYITATLNGITVRQVFIDPGSSINLLTLSTVKSINLPMNCITPQSIDVSGFSNHSQRALGYVNIDLQSMVVSVGVIKGRGSCIPNSSNLDTIGQPWKRIQQGL